MGYTGPLASAFYNHELINSASKGDLVISLNGIKYSMGFGTFLTLSKMHRDIGGPQIVDSCYINDLEKHGLMGLILETRPGFYILNEDLVMKCMVVRTLLEPRGDPERFFD